VGGNPAGKPGTLVVAPLASFSRVKRDRHDKIQVLQGRFRPELHPVPVPEQVPELFPPLVFELVDEFLDEPARAVKQESRGFFNGSLSEK